MKNSSVAICRTALAGLLVGFFAAPAYAGFEWTPPPPAPAMAAMPAEAMHNVPASPAAFVEAIELTPAPVTSEGDVAPLMEAPAPMAVVEDIALPAPAPTPAIEQESTALPASPFSETLDAPVAAGGPYAEAMGFGTDIPLALAMGQIVPSTFSYSFASNVAPGLKISWNGGKPWNQVLNESLAPHGLQAKIVGTAVIVRTVSGGASALDETARLPDHAMSDFSAQSQEALMREKATTEAVAEPAGTQVSLRGEGTADNYPRRSPQKKNFRGSIFTPDEKKGNSAPPPPAMEVDHAVIIENEVRGSAMPPRDADVAAAFEPAAPASMLRAIPAAAPTPLTTTQKISYADEAVIDRASVLTERDVPGVVENNSSKTLDPFEVSFWRAEANENLQDVLKSWSETAGVEVLWDSGYDYKLPAAISLHGTFPDAVSKVFSLYGKVEPRPQGRLHPNLPKGPSVLLVENYP